MNETKYQLRIILETDGDFSYKGRTHTVFLTDTYEAAYNLLIEELQLILDTLQGREYVIENVRKALSNLLKEINYFRDDEDYEFSSELLYFGNQEIEIDISEVSVLTTENYIKIEHNRP